MQRNKLRLLIPIVTLLLIMVSALYVQTTQSGLIQTSADTKDKTHFMNIWLIYLIPLVVLFVLPLHFKFQPLIQKPLKSERILLILGVLYMYLCFLHLNPTLSFFIFINLYYCCCFLYGLLSEKNCPYSLKLIQSLIGLLRLLSM